jgi:hypothetical protein
MPTSLFNLAIVAIILDLIYSLSFQLRNPHLEGASRAVHASDWDGRSGGSGSGIVSEFPKAGKIDLGERDDVLLAYTSCNSIRADIKDLGLRLVKKQLSAFHIGGIIVIQRLHVAFSFVRVG